MEPRSGSLSAEQEQRLRKLVALTENYPKTGITFLSIHPLLADAGGLATLVDAFASRYRRCIGPVEEKTSFFIAGLDARGFTVGTAVALALNVGFVMVRKQGKLPPPVISNSYSLEYGEDTIEVPVEAFPCSKPRVVVLDDLVATGGSMTAACELLRMAGAEIVEAGTILELIALPGRARLECIKVPLYSLLKYEL
jgi:adenine phosphoribosyltransferase